LTGLKVMAKKPIYGTDPEKILRLLSIGEDEQDIGEAQEDLENSPIISEVQANKQANRPDSSSSASTDEIIERLHTRIEGYRIIKVLGEGGMGIVYLAEQQYPVRRQVALKIIKPGMDSKRVLARFEAEQQTLARLDHPNIAKVFDAGTTETGCPFFVMEYVEGIAITDFCDRHKLGIKDRLRLFSVACQAIQHAHQKGIIHRDIKPSNILVTEQDGQPAPKIIDFGVAKAMGQPLTERTLKTEDSQLLGTPEYMSPEQANMAQELIDTCSDVYSLGVLLYVLLAGVLPFDPEALRKGGIDQIRRTIRESDPKTPSTRLTKLGEEAAAIAQNRRMEIQALARHLRKELEWIPLKAMRKERSERYRSASELSDDIENYLKGEPLIAGPPTSIYRLKKFMRRNAVLCGAVAAVGVTLFLGLAATTVLYLRADRQAQISEAVSSFLRNDLLESVSPTRAMGREVTVRSFLDAAAQSLETKFKDKPLVEASIRDTIGNIYRHLGNFEAAELHLERAYQLHRGQLGVED